MNLQSSKSDESIIVNSGKGAGKHQIKLAFVRLTHVNLDSLVFCEVPRYQD